MVGIPEDAIRERAYVIWEREGRPHGRDFEHWVRAQVELEAEAVRQSAIRQSAVQQNTVRRAAPEPARAAAPKAKAAAPKAGRNGRGGRAKRSG